MLQSMSVQATCWTATILRLRAKTGHSSVTPLALGVRLANIVIGALKTGALQIGSAGHLSWTPATVGMAQMAP